MSNYVSCRGKGVEGWKWFVRVKTPYETLPYPVRYDDNYATGTVLDVTPGLFAEGVAEKIKPFLNVSGTYPTGVCEDYNGNWMIRRSLWTDRDGTEHVAEGVVSNEGMIIDPIRIRQHNYAANTLYPLNGSWEDVWKVTDKGTWDKKSLYLHKNAGYVNLVVPLSFFDYVQHELKMYSFCELSSRTFYTGLSRLGDGNILVESAFDVLTIVWDLNESEDINVFFRGIISPEGLIIEPLHIDVPKNADRFLDQEYEERYADYFKKIVSKPQPWNTKKKGKRR